ncbi:MAG: hypothetical protein OQJ97_02330 [Rhodospirillales bacterium]|nr:hypothetical protein [Rhodospirillales bacterium]
MFGLQEGLDPDFHHGLVIGLNAVIVAVADDEPRVLVIRETSQFGNLNKEAFLPFGPFHPLQHRTLDMGLRAWVEAQTELNLGYVEQLYTFGDKGRDPREEKGGARVISIGYLALVSEAGETGVANTGWNRWYNHFPWEDWRQGKPVILDEIIEPRLKEWIAKAKKPSTQQDRTARMERVFAKDLGTWNDELVLERFELLFEAGLVTEKKNQKKGFETGQPLAFDHRRILATAMGRLRSKIKYRPVVFELMPPTFTLLQLQKLVEALSGKLLHKQNFRRLLDNNGLVEPTGQIETKTGGRPAKTFRFRRDLLAERETLGMKLPTSRK